MVHGSEAFFDERARSRRRVASALLTTSVVLLAALLAARIPPIQRSLDRLDLLHRFGFAGHDQFVRKIVLETPQPGPLATLNGARVDPVETHRGGAAHHRLARVANGTPRPVSRFVGPGLSDVDLLARARSMYKHAPVVQSEDLIIEKLVRPEYPEDAREHGVEGHVALVALVDTTGAVVNVDNVGDFP